LVDSVIKGSFSVLKSPSVLVGELISEFSSGLIDAVDEGLELGVRLVLHLHLLRVFVESKFEIFSENLLLSLDPWAIDWVRSESFSILSNLLQLGVDSLGLRGGHTDGPHSDALPFLGSGTKRVVFVFELPSVSVLELFS
jgi:hypothetical protein